MLRWTFADAASTNAGDGHASLGDGNWDSFGTHVSTAANKNPRFTGVLGADDGTRTHDLLHGKRVVGSLRLSCYAAWLCGIFLLGKVRVSSQIGPRLQAILDDLGSERGLLPKRSPIGI
jgi:hypothetical protein